MKLASAEVIPYALPFREPYVTARGSLIRREMALLRIRDADGVVGLGEAVPLSLRGAAALPRVVRDLEIFAERLELQADPNGEMSAPARCAISTARLDLLGRRAGDAEPTAGDAIPCNATLVAGAPAAVAADALRWARAGFTTFKLKLGACGAEGGDLEQVRAVREAVGPAARIRVDVNGAWDVETARRRLAELEPFGIELVEQPVATLGEMARLAATTAIPLAGDESVTTPAEAERAAALGACAYTGIKLSKVGGTEAALAIADLLPAYVSSALDGPVGIAAGGRLARRLAASGRPERLGPAHGLATQRLFKSSVAAVECRLRDGMLHLPPGPGLGVEIDDEALQAHRI